MACLSEGAYLLVEMFGNIRKGKKMKFAGAPGEPLSLAVPLLHFFFFNHFLLSHLVFQPIDPGLGIRPVFTSSPENMALGWVL